MKTLYVCIHLRRLFSYHFYFLSVTLMNHIILETAFYLKDLQLVMPQLRKKLKGRIALSLSVHPFVRLLQILSYSFGIS